MLGWLSTAAKAVTTHVWWHLLWLSDPLHQTLEVEVTMARRPLSAHSAGLARQVGRPLSQFKTIKDE